MLRLIPINCIAFHNESQFSDALYCGTDIGVYVARADVLDWKRVRGLPYVVVNDLHLHPGDGTLRVGTFGRGAWKAKVRR